MKLAVDLDNSLHETSILPQTNFFVKSGPFPSNFTHFFAKFCRKRRLRAFFKILAETPFSFPCLGQNLSSTPGLEWSAGWWQKNEKMCIGLGAH